MVRGSFNALACLCFLQTALHAKTLHIGVGGSDAAMGTVSNPWKTLEHAFRNAASGDTVRMGAGEFRLAGSLRIPAGVSLLGNGRSGPGKTAIAAAWSNAAEPLEFSSRGYILVAESVANQVIGDFTLEGAGRTVNGGLFMRGARNVEVRNLDILDFRFTGAWIMDGSNLDVHDLYIRDSSFENDNMCGGNFCFAGLTDSRIRGIRIKAWAPLSGYGMKAMGSPNHLTRVKIHDCHVDLKSEAAWAGGKASNISIELYQTAPSECEIYNNWVNQSISLVTQGTRPGPSIRLHHNRIEIIKGYGVELATSNMEVDHNHISGAYAGFAEWGDIGTLEKVSVHHNLLDGISRVGLQVLVPMTDLRVFNNTAVFGPDIAGNAAGWMPHAFLFKYGNKTGDRNWDVYNNIVVFPDSAKGKLLVASAGQIPASSRFRNNACKNMEITAGWASSANLAGDPGLQLSGAKPYPFFAPTGQTARIVDAGIRDGLPDGTWKGAGPDIGASEWDPETSGLRAWNPRVGRIGKRADESGVSFTADGRVLKALAVSPSKRKIVLGKVWIYQ